MSYGERPTGGDRGTPPSVAVRALHRVADRLRRHRDEWSRRYVEMQERALRERF
jgi:hypothetical protein